MQLTGVLQYEFLRPLLFICIVILTYLIDVISTSKFILDQVSKLFWLCHHSAVKQENYVMQYQQSSVKTNLLHNTFYLAKNTQGNLKLSFIFFKRTWNIFDVKFMHNQNKPDDTAWS